MEADLPGVAQDDGADLLEADGAGLGACQVAAGEAEAADRREERVGEAGEQQPQLVGPPFVTGGAIGEEFELLLDAVLHLAPGAVEILIEGTWLAAEIGDDVARVAAVVVVLDAGDDTRRSARQVRAA